MNKNCIAIALLALGAVAAHAQSSVTLFGVVDVNARQVDNDNREQKQLAGDGNSSSRWGIRGSEDLGGGLRASFWLESSVSADAGTANATRFWARRSTVSLSGNFGEIRLGRDQVPTWTILAEFDPFNVVGVATLTATVQALGGVDTRQRSDNLISYFLPGQLGGVYGQLSVAAGEGVAGRKYVGGRLGYRAGKLDLSGAYGVTEASVVNSDEVQVTVLAASYDFGVIKLIGTHTQQKFQTAASKAEDKITSAAVVVPLGAWQLKAQYSKEDGAGTLSARSAKHLGFGTQYNMSRRTALYANYGRIDNRGPAAFTVAAISGFTMPAARRSQGYELGLRHSF